VVGICLERSFELIQAVLAVLKAGGAYLPLDPDQAQHRLGTELADAAPALVITAGGLDALLPSGTARLALDDPVLATELAGMPATAPTDDDRRRRLRTQHPAYLIYTSGSTGRPKGVIVSHLSLANYLGCVATECLPDNVGDMPFFTTLTFDLTLTSVFAPLCRGRTVTIAQGFEQTFTVAEVELERRGVALARRDAYLSQRHTIDAARAEQLLRHIEQSLPCLFASGRHRGTEYAAVTTTTSHPRSRIFPAAFAVRCDRSCGCSRSLRRGW
jgi:acyl-CoA synthetase (AMP-forming)/AMP-acid ligase II